MTVYVDDWRQPARVGRLEAVWSHLTADTDEELHEFAARLGLRREWAQHMDQPNRSLHHYDVTESKRRQAIRLGAVAQSWRDTGRRVADERRRLAADLAPTGGDTDRDLPRGADTADRAIHGEDQLQLWAQ